MITEAEILTRLIEIRCSRGLTQQNVADRMNIARSSVCVFEKAYDGRSHTLATILRYAAAVGADLAVLGGM